MMKRFHNFSTTGHIYFHNHEVPPFGCSSSNSPIVGRNYKRKNHDPYRHTSPTSPIILTAASLDSFFSQKMIKLTRHAQENAAIIHIFISQTIEKKWMLNNFIFSFNEYV